MIYKSNLIEKKISLIKENIVLFYGENIGLQDELKQEIKKQYRNSSILNFEQDEIIKKEEDFYSEVLNTSLFHQEKIFVINNSNDKILEIIKKIETRLDVQKLFIFSNILDKKSKLRNYCETNNNFAVVACYKDNDQIIKKIIIDKLKGFQGLTPDNINLITENSNLDRVKLNNELNKITTYFSKKIIDKASLNNLLNIKINDDFSQLRDVALAGDRIKTNKLLSDTLIETDKNVLYINIINQRLNKLYEVLENSHLSNLNDAMNKIKPPIFWKDKPMFLMQCKKWSKAKIRDVLNKNYDIEHKIKSNVSINKKILIKKLLIDICDVANAA